jgi:hypothetical protein
VDDLPEGRGSGAARAVDRGHWDVLTNSPMLARPFCAEMPSAVRRLPIRFDGHTNCGSAWFTD